MASDWQTTKSTLKDRAGQLLLSGDLSDCEFCVGYDKISVSCIFLFCSLLD